MKTRYFSFLAICFIFATVLFVGCSDTSTDDSAPVNVSGPPPVDNGHAHEGPHGGQIIELGRSHEYHAEVVENETTGSVTVYILDKDMKELPIPEKTIVMNLKVKGDAKTFELTAAGENEAKSSRFETSNNTLFDALHDHDTAGKLRVTINGAPYSGDVEHHHHGDDHKH